MTDPATGRMAREGGQKMVAATFRHDTSRNLDPQLHTHAVIANMVQGEDGKWAVDGQREALRIEDADRGHLPQRARARPRAAGLRASRRPTPTGASRSPVYPATVVEAFSTRRAEIEAGMAERGMGSPSDNPRLAERAALMSRAAKRDIDRGELAAVWQHQGADLGFDAPALVAEAAAKGAEQPGVTREAAPDAPAGRGAAARGTGGESVASERESGRGARAAFAGRGGRGLGRRASLGARRRCSRGPTCSPRRSPGTRAR